MQPFISIYIAGIGLSLADKILVAFVFLLELGGFSVFLSPKVSKLSSDMISNGFSLAASFAYGEISYPGDIDYSFENDYWTD